MLAEKCEVLPFYMKVAFNYHVMYFTQGKPKKTEEWVQKKQIYFVTKFGHKNDATRTKKL